MIAESYLTPYIPAGIYLFILAATGLLMISASRFLGPRQYHPQKTTPYECGVAPLGTAREQFPVKFYLVAILFVLFDIETVFLIPWAVVFRRFGVLGVVEMLAFLAILAVGLLYVWRRRGLEWD